MEKTIWKYNLKLENNNLMIPKGAEILDIQVQNEKLTMWILCDPNEEKEERIFTSFGTGHPIGFDMGIDWEYLKTVQDGYFVWHIFEYLGV